MASGVSGTKQSFDVSLSAGSTTSNDSPSLEERTAALSQSVAISSSSRAISSSSAAVPDPDLAERASALVQSRVEDAHPMQNVFPRLSKQEIAQRLAPLGGLVHLDITGSHASSNRSKLHEQLASLSAALSSSSSSISSSSAAAAGPEGPHPLERVFPGLSRRQIAERLAPQGGIVFIGKEKFDIPNPEELARVGVDKMYAFLDEIEEQARKLNVPEELIANIRGIHHRGRIFIIVPTDHSCTEGTQLVNWLYTRAGKKEIAAYVEGMVRDPQYENIALNKCLKPLLKMMGVDLDPNGYLFGMEDPGFPEYMLFGNSFLALQNPATSYDMALLELSLSWKTEFEVGQTSQIWERFERAPAGQLNEAYRSCEFPQGASAYQRAMLFLEKIEDDPSKVVELCRQLTALALEGLPFTDKEKKDLTRLFLNNPDLKQAEKAYITHGPIRDPIIIRNVFSVVLPPDIIHVIPVGADHRDAILERIQAKLQEEEAATSSSSSSSSSSSVTK